MKKYQIIYADPPWSYRSGKVQGAAQNHYPTMPDEELYRLPVFDLADKNCTLFLWCTFPKLPEAIKLISAWGFSFKTVAFVWVKQNKSGNGFFMGLGWWTRSNAEICLLAVKGKPRRKSAGVRQLIISPLEQHSKKPDASTSVRQRAESVRSNRLFLIAVFLLFVVVISKTAGNRASGQHGAQLSRGHTQCAHHLDAVSYTHLDVYKRQVLGCPFSCSMTDFFFSRSSRWVAAANSIREMG